ncbi:MAG: MutS N-terminal domain-containing protein [Planctomycetota bacterium]|jgi:DNA mismatch repair ATPase MutS
MPKQQEKLTPAMKQFHHFKAKYPDAVLFFRLADVHEISLEEFAEKITKTSEIFFGLL